MNRLGRLGKGRATKDMASGPTILWALAAAAAVLGVVSGLADWKRSRRRDLDRPGWVPWTGLQLLALLVAVVAAALAVKG